MFDISNQMVFILFITIIVTYPKIAGYKRRIVHESKQRITFEK
jgi:hypothetical protein